MQHFIIFSVHTLIWISHFLLLGQSFQILEMGFKIGRNWVWIVNVSTGTGELHTERLW